MSGLANDARWVTACIAGLAVLAGVKGAYGSLSSSILASDSAIISDKSVKNRTFDEIDATTLAKLKALVGRKTAKSACPHAADVIKNIPVYDCSRLDHSDPKLIKKLQAEWYSVLHSGAGVLVLKKMYTDHAVLDAANAAFASIIAAEKAANGAKGDHFAPSSANDRIWNSFSKHCLTDPESFVKYYSNPFLALVCESYLGPAYRVTAQVNIVKPGGKPQVCHRDYPLGFQTAEDAARWPKAMQVASQLLTLQGAVAQTDMPLESGPTRLLPYSQLLEEGYLAYRKEEFNEEFLKRYVSVPLEKGDGLFFNPALFHAAGENQTSDFSRSANLLQISSAFGKTMETIETVPLIEKCWHALKEKHQSESMSDGVENVVKAIADGYPFPTNLDRRPPAPGGMAPESEQQIIFDALRKEQSPDEVVTRLRQMRQDSMA